MPIRPDLARPRHARFLAAALALAAGAACATPRTEHGHHDPKPGHGHGPESITVKLIAFNDYHGNLQSPGSFGANTAVPFAQRPPVGGADALAAWVARLKRENPLHAVVGAGDSIGASPLVSALFNDEPAVETLNRIGLEFNAVGNHEFDKGADELLRLQNGGCRKVDGVKDPNSCRGAEVGTPVPFEGAKFRWLAANVVSNTTGKPLLAPYGVKHFQGAKVAFIGMTLKGTPSIVTPSGVAGLSFRDEADTVNALVPQLRRQGIEAIVVLVHQGGFQAAGLSDINGCDGNLQGTDLANIVSRLDDAVDVVVSGHTHAAYNCSAGTVDVRSAGGTVTRTPRPTGLANARGRLVPVTSSSAFGRVLTDIDLTIDRRSKDVTAVKAVNRLVDRSDAEIQVAMQADPRVTHLVNAYGALVSPIANAVIGSITRDLPNSADAAGNMPAGELVADAQLAATAPASFGGAVIAFMNPGGVRSPGFLFAGSAAGEGAGNVTYGEAFTVQPFGNSLVTLTLTAQELKDALEQQFAGCRGQANTRLLIPAAGLKYAWSAGAACDQRVRDLRLVNAQGAVVDQIVSADGAVLNPARTYRVTVNNFLATGGDGFTTFAAGGAPLGGAQDIDALTAYLANFHAPRRPAYDPDAAALLKPRIVRLP